MMALINCPECGNQVSDTADHCVVCGYPLRSSKNNFKEKKVKKFNHIFLFIIGAIIFIAVVGNLFSDSTETNSENLNSSSQPKESYEDILNTEIKVSTQAELNAFIEKIFPKLNDDDQWNFSMGMMGLRQESVAHITGKFNEKAYETMKSMSDQEMEEYAEEIETKKDKLLLTMVNGMNVKEVIDWYKGSDYYQTRPQE